MRLTKASSLIEDPEAEGVAGDLRLLELGAAQCEADPKGAQGDEVERHRLALGRLGRDRALERIVREGAVTVELDRLDLRTLDADHLSPRDSGGEGERRNHKEADTGQRGVAHAYSPVRAASSEPPGLAARTGSRAKRIRAM
jgi:hypothetical protein